jgi:hypothetical protein
MFVLMTQGEAQRWGLALGRVPFHPLVYDHLVYRLLLVRVGREIETQTCLLSEHLAAQHRTCH